MSLTLDHSHFTSGGISDDEVEPLIAHPGHLHRCGAAPGRLQTPFGESTIDFARVLRQMRATGYGGYFAIE